MLARPLLVASRFPVPVIRESVFDVTPATQGAWPWGNAHNFGDQVPALAPYDYIAFTNNAGGIRVAIWNETTRAVTQSILSADGATATDQHNCPALWLRSDGRLLAIFAAHSSPNMWRLVTVNTLASDPTISGGWQAGTNIDSQLGATAYTYPDIYTGPNGPVLFYRDQDPINNWEFSESIDDGDTWSAFTNLFYATRAYGRIHMSSPNQWDFLVTSGSYAADYADVHHFQRRDGVYLKSDGTPMAGSPPFPFSEMTKIYDGSTASAGARAPADIVRIGDEVAATWSVHTGVPGPFDADDEDYLYARWRNGAWTVSTVATAIGGLTVEYTEGGLVVDRLNLNRLAVSRRASSSLSENFHLYDYRSRDHGATWPAVLQKPIIDTGDPAMYPTYIRGYRSGLRLVALQGPDWTSSTVFNTHIVGVGRAA